MEMLPRLQKNKSANRNNLNITPQSIESNTSTLSPRSSIVLSESYLEIDKLPCSASFIDLLILILRYKRICQELIDLIIPRKTFIEVEKLIRLKFNCINNCFQVITFKYFGMLFLEFK